MKLQTILLTAALLASQSAGAAVINFTATRTNNPTAPTVTPNCPGLTLAFLPGAPTFNQGTSNLGDFAATIFECPIAAPPAPNVNSPWSFAFANGTLFGTKSGNPTGPVPGGVSFVSNFVILGGTGFFEGATGGFTGRGEVIFTRTPAAIEMLVGTITTPAPSGMALFGLGLGAFALKLGRARSRAAT